jgi:hypothetical protein
MIRSPPMNPMEDVGYATNRPKPYGELAIPALAVAERWMQHVERYATGIEWEPTTQKRTRTIDRWKARPKLTALLKVVDGKLKVEYVSHDGEASVADILWAVGAIETNGVGE